MILFRLLVEIAKKCWRFIERQKLKQRYVFIASSVIFNKKTSFEGFNKIHENVSIGSCKIGRYTYIGRRSQLNQCKVGRFTSIAHDVVVEPYTHPVDGFLSTSPVFFSTLGQCAESFVSKQKFKEQKTIDSYNCIIGNDVWIGANVKIIGGLSIGDGAIVAAGAVVTKNVPPYAIVGGVPAKIIRYRFSEEEIKILMNFQWWNKDVDWIKKNADFFSNETDFFKLIENE